MILNLYKLFETYVNDSKHIASFDSGDSFEVQKKDVKYPQLFLETPWNITSYQKGSKIVNFAILICDIYADDKHDVKYLEQKVESLSDLLLEELDLSQYDEFDEIVSANAVISKDFGNDNTVCARIEISMRVLRDKNYCLAKI
jgi:hypothetical protein